MTTEVQLLKAFGNNLADQLEDAWMTQKELAEETGLSEATISRYISGDVMPTLKSILNIMYALDCDFEDLVDGAYGKII